MQIKLLILQGDSGWSFRQHDDEMFFVHRGCLLMKFRDREEIVEGGEFIVVPHGVEHCPVAVGEETCEVLLIDPTGTIGESAAAQ
jgi:mannose-6-phosphate isomerase-like protein (cupin superfamily)